MNDGPTRVKTIMLKMFEDNADDKTVAVVCSLGSCFPQQQEKLCYKIVRDVVKVSVFCVVLDVGSFVGVRNLEASQLGKGLVQVLADSLVLLLLCQKFVFQSVHLLLELGNCPLSLCGTVLGIL